MEGILFSKSSIIREEFAITVNCNTPYGNTSPSRFSMNSEISIREVRKIDKDSRRVGSV